MHFNQFYRAMREHDIRICATLYSWNANDCPFKVKTIGDGWHSDQKYCGMKLLFKMLGNVAHGILKENRFSNRGSSNMISETLICNSKFACPSFAFLKQASIRSRT